MPSASGRQSSPGVASGATSWTLSGRRTSWSACAAGSARRRLPSRRPVVQLHEDALEVAFAQQLEPQEPACGQRPIAGAHHDRRQEQVTLVDKARAEGERGKLRTADAEVSLGGRLQLEDGLRVEIVLDPGPGARELLQRSRVDDLVG